MWPVDSCRDLGRRVLPGVYLLSVRTLDNKISSRSRCESQSKTLLQQHYLPNDFAEGPSFLRSWSPSIAMLLLEDTTQLLMMQWHLLRARARPRSQQKHPTAVPQYVKVIHTSVAATVTTTPPQQETSHHVHLDGRRRPHTNTYGHTDSSHRNNQLLLLQWTFLQLWHYRPNGHTHNVTAHTGYTSATYAFHSGIKVTLFAPEHSTQGRSLTTKSHQESFPGSETTLGEAQICQHGSQSNQGNATSVSPKWHFQCNKHSEQHISPLNFRNLIVKLLF